MYIAIYDENKKHITNVDNATYDLTTRVYDNDSFSAEGVCDVDINDAKIAVLNDDRGNYEYACFADEIKPEYNKRTVKGLDFKTLWDTEILLDYTADGSFDGRLSAIFTKVKTQVFDGKDTAVNKIPIVVNIPTDNTAASNGKAIANVTVPAKTPVVAGEQGICSNCGVATLSIDYKSLGETTGKMAVKILKGESKVSEMPIEYSNSFVKYYNPDICEQLGIKVPSDDYTALSTEG